MFNIGDIVQFKNADDYGYAMYEVIGIHNSANGVILTIHDIEEEDNYQNGNGYYSWRFKLVRKEEYLDEA